MARSSIQGADRAPTQAEGRDVEALGPSDTSDSGSDIQGELDLASPLDLDQRQIVEQTGLRSDSDVGGTGERGAALADEEAREAADIMPDEIRSLSGEADDAADVAAEAELEFDELTSGEVPALDEDEDLEEDDET